MRMPPTEQLRQVVIKLAWPAREKNPGSIFMDAPPHSSFAVLVEAAGDRTAWRSFAKNISRCAQQRRHSGRLSARFAKRPAAAM